MGFDLTGLGAVFDLGGKLIDRLIPDPAAKQAATLQLLALQQSGELAQLASETDLAKGQLTVNAAEASNPVTFVSGWRPFVGWVCGFGLASQFLVGPFATFTAGLVGKAITYPSLDIGTLLTLLLGMLGLGAARTVEKINGVASK